MKIYRSLRAINRNLRKIEFYRITGMTRPLPIRTPAVQFDGHDATTWADERDKWLLDTSPRVEAWLTDYSTEPMSGGRRRIITQPLYERFCDCGLVAGQMCNCAA